MTETEATGRLALLADDDPLVRGLLAEALSERCGVTVVEAEDGAHAVQLALQLRPSVAVLDLQMPRLDGVQAARTIRGLLPALPLALHSSDLPTLRERASGLGVPLFDKLAVDALADWVGAQVASSRDELVCRACGYGIVARRRPARCPLCQALGRWIDRSHEAAVARR